MLLLLKGSFRGVFLRRGPPRIALLGLRVTAFCKDWPLMHVCEENRNVFGVLFMDPTPTIDLAGLCLVVVAHAGILALRLGISLNRA